MDFKTKLPGKFVFLLLFQFILLILFLLFVRYGGAESKPTVGFEDTHVMIFIGFGFLMTFLKKYCYSALGLNFLLAALAIQWAILCQGFFELPKDGDIQITKKSLLEADIMSATVLITFGALLGLASATQLLIITVIEIALGCVNLYLINNVFKAADIGGSMAIHAFGAYFGLAVSKVYNMKTEGVSASLNGPSYASDVTAMIGSIFLWIYWPSFNSGLTSGAEEYQRAVLNTYLSLAAATVVSFVMSAFVNHGKFDMVHIQNSTLAGGVAVGSVANMHIGPGGAIAVGMGSGILSALGYHYLTPKLAEKGLLDTCGVNNLHGMPAIFSGLLSILIAAIATPDVYGSELGIVFPGLAKSESSETPRTVNEQAMYQAIALVVTLLIAIVGGTITGFITKLKVFSGLKEEERYIDDPNWELPS